MTPTGRYSIGEAAKLLGLHRNTLLRYTNEGFIKCGFRRDTAKKFFTGEEILKFWRAQL